MENDDVGFILACTHNIIARTGFHCAPLVHKIIGEGKDGVHLSLSRFTQMKNARLRLMG